MPHIVIEHSVGLKVDAAMQDLQSLVCNFGEFNPKAVKSRSIAFTDFILPDDNVDFVHVTISIMAGRAVELRKSLADQAFAILQNNFNDVANISLDIREMVAETYRKK